jgi:hypothetical protein
MDHPVLHLFRMLETLYPQRTRRFGLACIALPGCTGVLYKDSRDAKKKRIRTPIKIHPDDDDFIMTDMPDGDAWHANRPHSTVPIYFAINDLPREQRYLQVNVMCPAILPGPNEPTSDQMNHCLEPSVKEMILLKVRFGYFCALTFH